jgi:hypothetical protein
VATRPQVGSGAAVADRLIVRLFLWFAPPTSGHYPPPPVSPRKDSAMPLPRSASTPVPATWSLAGHVASAGEGGVRLDLDHPSAGLVTPTADRLLGIEFGVEGPPVDHWRRGPDITAVWESGDERALRATGLWRHLPVAGDGVTAWELIASASTARLHADSTLAVVCDLHADGLLSAAWEGARPAAFIPGHDPRRGIILVRRRGAPSVLVMIHPSDHQAVTLTHLDHRARIDCWLFPTGVEKGVLLRSRVLAALGPAEGDLRWSGDLAREFAASPPDLAT